MPVVKVVMPVAKVVIEDLVICCVDGWQCVWQDRTLLHAVERRTKHQVYISCNANINLKIHKSQLASTMSNEKPHRRV